MKTLGRIVIILIAFALVMGGTYVAVNAGASSLGSGTRLGNGDRPFPQNGQFQPGQRPPGDFAGRREGGEGRGGSIVGLLAGFVKNSIIIAVVVVLIAAPRSWLRSRKRVMPAVAE